MKQSKTIVLKLFLFLELFIFAVIYIFGTHGVHAIIRLNNENQMLAHDIEALEEDIERLTLELKNWEENPFLKEKIAREHLQMARKNETIYFLS